MIMIKDITMAFLHFSVDLMMKESKVTFSRDDLSRIQKAPGGIDPRFGCLFSALIFRDIFRNISSHSLLT